ncbi:MAG: hypothetical protein SV377_01795 [Halobacteria archaeon]|nr:hypothetical protein [Halobacteria archaeon]
MMIAERQIESNLTSDIRIDEDTRVISRTRKRNGHIEHEIGFERRVEGRGSGPIIEAKEEGPLGSGSFINQMVEEVS